MWGKIKDRLASQYCILALVSRLESPHSEGLNGSKTFAKHDTRSTDRRCAARG